MGHTVSGGTYGERWDIRPLYGYSMAEMNTMVPAGSVAPVRYVCMYVCGWYRLVPPGSVAPSE